MEPTESPFVSQGISGSHDIDGVGIGFMPPMRKHAKIDEFVTVHTDEAKQMVDKLAKEEGIFAETSSGSNVVAAIKTGHQLGPGNVVVTLMMDLGLKYLK